MNIALFGGSFDPPHRGHQRIVEEALRILPIETLIIVPAWQNPFKTEVHASGLQRYTWLKTIFAACPKVLISDFEIQQERSVYTIETVRHFAHRYDQVYLIIGADNLAQLSQWHQYQELRDSVHFVIASRDTIEVPEEMIVLNIQEPISSTEVRKNPTSLGLDPEIEKQIIPYYKKEKHESKN